MIFFVSQCLTAGCSGFIGSMIQMYIWSSRFFRLLLSPEIGQPTLPILVQPGPVALPIATLLVFQLLRVPCTPCLYVAIGGPGSLAIIEDLAGWIRLGIGIRHGCIYGHQGGAGKLEGQASLDVMVHRYPNRPLIPSYTPRCDVFPAEQGGDSRQPKFFGQQARNADLRGCLESHPPLSRKPGYLTIKVSGCEDG